MVMRGGAESQDEGSTPCAPECGLPSGGCVALKESSGAHAIGRPPASQALHADAETALKTIKYVDALLECRASVQALVGATAATAECVCGPETGDGDRR